MRTIINYIRSLFCKHTFIFEETMFTCYTESGEIEYKGEVVYKRCTKCGYESSRKKWDV